MRTGDSSCRDCSTGCRRGETARQRSRNILGHPGLAATTPGTIDAWSTDRGHLFPYHPAKTTTTGTVLMTSVYNYFCTRSFPRKFDLFLKVSRWAQKKMHSDGLHLWEQSRQDFNGNNPRVQKPVRALLKITHLPCARHKKKPIEFLKQRTTSNPHGLICTPSIEKYLLSNITQSSIYSVHKENHFDHNAPIHYPKIVFLLLLSSHFFVCKRRFYQHNVFFLTPPPCNSDPPPRLTGTPTQMSSIPHL